MVDITQETRERLGWQTIHARGIDAFDRWSDGRISKSVKKIGELVSEMSKLIENIDPSEAAVLFQSDKFAIVEREGHGTEVRFFYAEGVSGKWFMDGAAAQLRELVAKHGDDVVFMDDKLEVRCGLEWDADFDVRPADETATTPGI